MNTIFLEKTIASNKYKSKTVTRMYINLLYHTKIKKLVRYMINDGIKYNEVQDLIRAIKLIDPITTIIKDKGILVQAYSSDKFSILSICDIVQNTEAEYSMDNIDRNSKVINVTLVFNTTNTRYIYDLDEQTIGIVCRQPMKDMDVELLNKATKLIIKKYFLSE